MTRYSSLDEQALAFIVGECHMCETEVEEARTGFGLLGCSDTTIMGSGIFAVLQASGGGLVDAR